MAKTQTLPMCTDDYRMDFCEEQKAELIASGEYVRVWIVPKRPEIGARGQIIPFGQVYIEREI